MKNNSASHTDTDLIHRIREGNDLAFRQLVDRYKDVSLSLACSIIKDTYIAEDILQDAFIKVYHKLDTFNFKSSFSTWLYRIVVNTSYNALKKGKYHIDINAIEEKLTSTHRPVEYSSLHKEQQKEYIQKALSLLKPDEALVLRLFYLSEMSMKEIKKITRFSTSKIKVDLHRGRNNLRYRLQKLLETEINDLL